MSKVKISQLPSANTLTGSEQLPVVQNGQTVKTTAQNIADLGVGNLQFANNGGVEFNGSNQLTTIYNSTVTTGTSQAIGALSSQSASFWQNKTIVQVLDAILFPTQYPTYQIPTISFSTTTSPLIVEVGSPVPSITLKGSGQNKDAGSYNTFSFYRSVDGGSATLLSPAVAPTSSSATANPSQFGYPSNNTNYLYEATKVDNTYSTAFPLPSSSNVSIKVDYTMTGQYSAGNANYNSNGVLDSRGTAIRQSDRQQASSSDYSSGNTISFTGYYPVYYGTSIASSLSVSDIATAISSGTGASKLAIGSSNGNITIPFGTDSTLKWMWFAVYRYNTAKTKWYNSSLNNGSIGGAVNLFGSPTIQAVTSHEGYWASKDYNIYITNFKSAQFGDYIMSNS